MRILGAIDITLAFHLGGVPAVALLAVASIHVQVDVGAVAVRICSTVKVAILVLPNVLCDALAGACIDIFVRASFDYGTVEVAKHVVSVPSKSIVTEAGFRAIIHVLAVGVHTAIVHAFEKVYVPQITIIAPAPEGSDSTIVVRVLGAVDNTLA